MFSSDRKGHSSSTSYHNDKDYHGKQVLGEAQNIFGIKANSLTAKVRNSDIRFLGLQNYIFEHLTYRMRFLSLRHADNFLEVERCIISFYCLPSHTRRPALEMPHAQSRAVWCDGAVARSSFYLQFIIFAAVNILNNYLSS